jgi:hypothetical protein
MEAMAVDRKARDQLWNALARFMAGEIRSFEFDDEVSQFLGRKATCDNSVRTIGRELWRTYDDLITRGNFHRRPYVPVDGPM